MEQAAAVLENPYARGNQLRIQGAADGADYSRVFEFRQDQRCFYAAASAPNDRGEQSDADRSTVAGMAE